MVGVNAKLESRKIVNSFVRGNFSNDLLKNMSFLKKTENILELPIASLE